MISDKEALELLLRDKRKDLMAYMVQEWLLQREHANPQKMGKMQAEEMLGTYQTAVKNIELQINSIIEYAKTIGLTLD